MRNRDHFLKHILSERNFPMIQNCKHLYHLINFEINRVEEKICSGHYERVNRRKYLSGQEFYQTRRPRHVGYVKMACHVISDDSTC